MSRQLSAQKVDVHVTMDTSTAHLLLWAVTIFVRVHTECTWNANNRLHFYPDAQLWDGQVSEGGGTCCQLHNPPWFTKNLPIPTDDSIELQLCMINGIHISNIALELLELTTVGYPRLFSIKETVCMYM